VYSSAAAVRAPLAAHMAAGVIAAAAVQLLPSQTQSNMKCCMGMPQG
jgi:hypothetical protein